MLLRFVPAPAALAPWVLGATVLRGAGEPFALPLPAHALALFTWVLRGRVAAGAATRHALGAGSSATWGSASQARLLAYSGDTVCASLLCRASVLPLLTGEAAHVFTDAAVDAAALRLPIPAAWLEGPLPPDDGAIASALFHAIASRLQAARAPRASALRFGRALAAWEAVAQPAAVARPPAGWSERQWQRACRDETGLTPKLLLRLARLHASVRAQADPSRLPWAEHALEAGYCDQAHLARDYRALAGLPPARAFEADGAVARALRFGAAELAPRFFAP